MKSAMAAGMSAELRAETREHERIHVLISSLAADGRVLTQEAETLDISANGGRVHKLKSALPVDAIVAIHNDGNRARFRVLWKGSDHRSSSGQYGLVRTKVARRSSRCLWIDNGRKMNPAHKQALHALAYDFDVIESTTEAATLLAGRPYGAVIINCSAPHLIGRLAQWKQISGGAGIIVFSDNGILPAAVAEMADAVLAQDTTSLLLVNAIEDVLSTPVDAREGTRLRKRFAVRLPVEVSVTRDGDRFSFFGISDNLGATGIGVMIEGQLEPGELIEVQFALPNRVKEIQAHAIVRHRRNRSCGIEFVSIQPDDEISIRAFCSVLPPLSMK